MATPRRMRGDRRSKSHGSGRAAARWEWLEDKIRALMHRYGYANVRTPIVEPTALFVRGLGEVTDIVEKEMFSWTDAMNGDALTLRPEATAGIVLSTVGFMATAPLWLALLGWLER